MIKVLFLRTIRGLDAPSGAEVYLSYLARFLKHHGVSPYFLFSIDPRRDHSVCLSIFESAGAEFDLVQVPGKFSLKDMQQALQTANRLDVDIIHTMDHRSDFIGAFIQYFGHRPVVASFQGWTGFAPNSWRLHLYGRIDSLALRTMNTVFIDSRRMAENLGNLAYSRKIQYAPNGIDVDQFHPNRVLPRKKQETTFLQVARYHPNKGQFDFVQAAERVLKVFPDTRFILLGDSNKGGEQYESNIRRYVTDHELHNVSFHTPVAHDCLPQVIADADVLVASSHCEGLSLAVLEAMSMEKLIICYDSGGIGEILTHKKNALITPVGDIEALATEMMRAIETPDYIKLLAKAGRRLVVKSYSVNVMVENIANKYRSILAEK